jgi:transcriptional regulator with XRE-family HTH domain
MPLARVSGPLLTISVRSWLIAPAGSVPGLRRGAEAVADASPTIRQRELGMRLRELRTSKSLTVEDVARELMCSATKISRAETGARRPSLRDVRDLCALYQVDDEASAALMELAKEARKPGWWSQYSDLNDFFAFIGVEQDATAITCFGMYFLPGLMQTEDYARALITSINPQVNAEIVEERVKARMLRQELLTKPKPPRYRVILDEAVLRRPVGGWDVMKGQFERILQLTEEKKVTVQILPFEVGTYTATDSNFDFLEFANSALGSLVFVEGFGFELYLDRPAQIERYRESIESLRDTALSPQNSVKKIQEICDKYESYLQSPSY